MNLEDLYRLLRSEHVQAQGIVDTVPDPLLVLSQDLCVLSASRAFFETFRAGRDETLGRPLYELGNRQWDIPELRHLLEQVVPTSAAVIDYEVQHDFPGVGRRTMLLGARRLFHPDNNSTTLLLSIEDATERRPDLGEERGGRDRPSSTSRRNSARLTAPASVASSCPPSIPPPRPLPGPGNGPRRLRLRGGFQAKCDRAGAGAAAG